MKLCYKCDQKGHDSGGCDCEDMNCDCNREMKKAELKERGEESIKELFDMVYQWGRAGVKVDYTSKTFQDKVKEIKGQSLKQISTYDRSSPDPNDVKFQCSCGEIFSLAECEDDIPECPICGNTNEKAYQF